MLPAGPGAARLAASTTGSSSTETLMKRPLDPRVAAVLVLFGLASCTPQAPEGMMPPPMEVAVRQPVERDLVDHAEATGRTEAKEIYEVRVRVKGYLQSISFCEGAHVKKGDLLYQIDPCT